MATHILTGVKVVKSKKGLAWTEKHNVSLFLFILFLLLEIVLEYFK